VPGAIHLWHQQQIASLDEVQWAVLETSGAISFIRKTDS